jgi:hypothetical protein
VPLDFKGKIDALELNVWNFLGNYGNKKPQGMAPCG